ncbi:MAG: transposase [Acidobacteria bacterium]|nr:transposase [Acidobacteriota bacterium]
MKTDKNIPSTDSTQIAHLRERLRSRSLDEQDWQLLDRLLGSFLTLIDLLQRKNASIKRLKRWLFGSTSDKRASAEQKPPVSDLDNSAVLAASLDVTTADSATEPKERPRGHGRRSAYSYTGAQVVSCEDPALKPGDRCPQCAACGEVLFADDTRVKILDCVKENKSLPESERRGLQTTGIVARGGGKQIALYRSGRQHAGENIDRLLEHRLPELAIPIQAGDAISANWSRKSATIPAKCLAHARRQFVEIEESFPRECKRVLDAIGEVYENDWQTKQMAPAERLQFHQQHSGPVIEELRAWIDEQFRERKVEPNSALGHALSYMKRHWEELTQFLRTEHAPLDNNPAERSLKRAVLLRKNALFYKTEHGAAIGDILLSVIETCRLNQVNAWDYLVCVVRQARAVRRDPAGWLPWNYARGEPTRLVA